MPYNRFMSPGQGRPQYAASIPSNPRISEAEDPGMDELRKRLATLTIGSLQHEQLRTEARQQGRCLDCFSKGHFSRNCPFRQYQVNSVQWYSGSETEDYDTAMERACQAHEEWERNHPEDDNPIQQNEESDPESAQ
jgi:hypothetical protein